MNIAISITAWLGGLIGLFAGRRFYHIWLGLVTFLFFMRVFDLALFNASKLVHVGVSLVIAIMVTVLVIVYRTRVVRIVPALGASWSAHRLQNVCWRSSTQRPENFWLAGHC